MMRMIAIVTVPSSPGATMPSEGPSVILVSEEGIGGGGEEGFKMEGVGGAEAVDGDVGTGDGEGGGGGGEGTKRKHIKENSNKNKTNK